MGLLGLSKPIIQPTQLGFGLSLAGMWQKTNMLGLNLELKIKQILYMTGFDSIDLNEALEKLDFVSTKTFVITRSKSNIWIFY